jgi:hypothetical protein
VRVTNGISLGCSPLLPIGTVNCTQTLKAKNQLKGIFAGYERDTRRFRNFLAVQKESLRILFHLTATQQFGKHYAASKVDPNCDEREAPRACYCGGCGAIPADNGKPQYESLFGSSLERLYYTALMFINPSKGIPVDLIRRDVLKYVDDLQSEYSKSDGKESCELTSVEASRNEFRERYGGSDLQLRGFTESEYIELTALVNNNVTLQLPLIRKFIFPELDVYKEEIESSTHMFPFIVKPHIGLRGMSGTIFNKDTFPNMFDSNTIMHGARF